jgi:proteasome lid subunit RPN8/RPN11
MIEPTLTAIRAHALTSYPAESCGLVCVVRGKERYIPCRNMAETASEHFVMSAQDYADAED